MVRMKEQMLVEVLLRYPAENAAAVREICEDLFGRVEEIIVEIMVKHLGTAEILEVARCTASAEGQAVMSKMYQIMADSSEFCQREFKRMAAQRHSNRPLH